MAYLSSLRRFYLTHRVQEIGRSSRSGRINRSSKRHSVTHYAPPSQPLSHASYTATSKLRRGVAPPLNPPAANSVIPSQPGLLSSLKEGLVHGVGWAFGQRAVDALMGPRVMEIQHTNSDPDPSSSHETSYTDYQNQSPHQETEEFHDASNDMEDDSFGWGDGFDFGDD